MVGMKARYAILLPFFLSIAYLSGAASAASGNMTVNQTLLNFSAQYAQCKTVFTTSFLSDLQSASPKFSSYSQYSNTLQQYNSHLSQLALNGNVSAYESYQSGTYDRELDNISGNVSLRIKSANLSANALAKLRQQYNSSLATYNNCTSLKLKAYAEEKLSMFNQQIGAYQDEAVSLNALGIDTSNLTMLLATAQIQIVTPLSNAISSAKNNSQLLSALQEYCLFDGCGNGTNFHLAAHFGLDKLELVLGYLESDKNISASSLSGAQAHLNNASSILVTVGSKAYVDNQGKNIFANLSAASKEMTQAKKQDSFSRVKSAAKKVLDGYEATLSVDSSAVAKLAAQGMNTTQLNATLSGAETSIIAPLSSGLNSSTNSSQIVSLFNSYCLGNGCDNGTNYHLDTRLKLGEDSAYLAYQEARANATTLIIVNQSALSAAESDLSDVSSLLSTVGSGHFSGNQTAQISLYFIKFTASMKQAFRANLSSVSAVNAINGTVINAHRKHNNNGATTASSATSNGIGTHHPGATVSSNASVSGASGTSAGSNGINASVNASVSGGIKTHGK